MVINELRLADFMVFPGEQTLAIPSHTDTNLIIILAAAGMVASVSKAGKAA